MRVGLLGTIGGGVLAAAALLGGGESVAVRRECVAEFVLDQRRLDFAEDESTGRVVAEVRAALVRGADGGIGIRIRVSAQGAAVVPEPGFEGIGGANRITAVELESAITAGRFAIHTTGDGGKAGCPGSVEVVRRGRVPLRRIRGDGSVDYAAGSDDVLPLEVEFRTGAAGDGRHLTEILLNGAPRLAVRFECSSGRGRILRLEGVSRTSSEAP